MMVLKSVFLKYLDRIKNEVKSNTEKAYETFFFDSLIYFFSLLAGINGIAAMITIFILLGIYIIWSVFYCLINLGCRPNPNSNERNSDLEVPPPAKVKTRTFIFEALCCPCLALNLIAGTIYVLTLFFTHIYFSNSGDVEFGSGQVVKKVDHDDFDG